jgi:rubredoxin
MKPDYDLPGHLTCMSCGHVFDTEKGRRDHEQAGQRGEFTKCPCGNVCCRITDHAWVGIEGHPDDPECSICQEHRWDHAEEDV